MKRIYSITLIIMIIVSLLFAGCGKSKGKDETDSRDVSTDNNFKDESDREGIGSAEDDAYTAKGTSKEAHVYLPENETADSALDKAAGIPYDMGSGEDKEEQQYEIEDTGRADYDADSGETEALSQADEESGMRYFSGANKSTAYESDYDILPPGSYNSEEYTQIDEGGFKQAYYQPLSTFSIDVDTASYSHLRKCINYGQLPDEDSVRIEEMLNYFDYDYKQPKDAPFSINAELGICPWNEEHYLLMVGLQGKKVEEGSLPKSNLVFLIDVSGSMDQEDKLPLLKNAFSQLVKELEEDDRVSIVVYAGKSGIVLDSVPGSEKEVILEAIASLQAGGSTAGASGISLAYKLAAKNFREDGNNRVILATDGDFNVGASSMEELEELITQKRDSGIFLSVMGFGVGNIKDNRMELLADKGNGNYSYIDSPREAKKVLVDEMAGTLLTIAKDVKIQLEFNPYSVKAYRLIGYENRALKNKDFKNDSIDAGELGAGHSVTAVYEIIPAGGELEPEYAPDIKYRSVPEDVSKNFTHETAEIRLRFKEPDQDESREIKRVVSAYNKSVKPPAPSKDFYFAASVIEFGMIVRKSQFMGNSDIESVLRLAESGLGEDEEGYRSEFIDMVETYEDFGAYRW